jgi:hypothetical protein
MSSSNLAQAKLTEIQLRDREHAKRFMALEEEEEEEHESFTVPGTDIVVPGRCFNAENAGFINTSSWFSNSEHILFIMNFTPKIKVICTSTQELVAAMTDENRVVYNCVGETGIIISGNSERNGREGTIYDLHPDEGFNLHIDRIHFLTAYVPFAYGYDGGGLPNIGYLTETTIQEILKQVAGNESTRVFRLSFVNTIPFTISKRNTIAGTESHDWVSNNHAQLGSTIAHFTVEGIIDEEPTEEDKEGNLMNKYTQTEENCEERELNSQYINLEEYELNDILGEVRGGDYLQNIMEELEEIETKWETILHLHELHLMFMPFNPLSIEQRKLLVSRKIGMKKAAKIVTIIRDLKKDDSKEIDYQILLCELVTAEINEKVIQARVDEVRLTTLWDNAIEESTNLFLKLRNASEYTDEQEIFQLHKISVKMALEAASKLAEAQIIVKSWEESDIMAETAIIAWKSFVTSATTLSGLRIMRGNSDLIQIVTEKTIKLLKLARKVTKESCKEVDEAILREASSSLENRNLWCRNGYSAQPWCDVKIAAIRAMRLIV